MGSTIRTGSAGSCEPISAWSPTCIAWGWSKLPSSWTSLCSRPPRVAMMEMGEKRGGVEWRKGKICGQTCPATVVERCRGWPSRRASSTFRAQLGLSSRDNNQNEGLQDTTITLLYHQADRSILHTESPLMMAASFRIWVCAVHAARAGKGATSDTVESKIFRMPSVRCGQWMVRKKT